MKRESVQPVTLPILVTTDDEKEADRWGTFLPVGWTGSHYIHVVTEQDVRKWLRTEMSPKEHGLFIGLSHLKAGCDGADEYTLMLGYDKLRPLVKDLAPPDQIKFDVSLKDGRRIPSSGGSQKWSGTHWHYSGLLTEMLRKSRLVTWYSEKHGQFLPALFCLDKKTAIFAMRLVGPIRVCPHCEALFVPDALNRLTCKEHAGAYRVRRFRAKAK